MLFFICLIRVKFPGNQSGGNKDFVTGDDGGGDETIDSLAHKRGALLDSMIQVRVLL